VTPELSTRSARPFGRDRRTRCACFSSCAPPETDRPSSPYRLEEPSSPTNPRLTSRVALQAPPADSIPPEARLALRLPLRDAQKQAVLTCRTRDASPRLGEELGVDTPRRLPSCTANDVALAGDLARVSLALRDEEPAETRAPFHLGQSRMSRQRGMRASLRLRRSLRYATFRLPIR
jgi:hypothetical protein